jgi:hypothetical protein
MQFQEECQMHKNINEGLKKNDLRDLVNPVFEVDSYKSKMGDDQDVVVLAFEVTGHQAAVDLSEFIEKSHDFVLDADVSSGENQQGNYKVFVEIERTRKSTTQIFELLYGLTELTEVKDWKFKYYKEYLSKPLSEITSIPVSASEYNLKMEKVFESEIKFFFAKTPLDHILVENDILTFKRPYVVPVKMKLIKHGTRTDILNNIDGFIRVDESSISETLWLTKYFGNYNITKYGNDFVFENENMAIIFQILK